MPPFKLHQLIFEEGPDRGNIAMVELTGGVNGLTYLVKSLHDGKLYVRKQVTTRPNLPPAEVTILPYIPASCSVPKLIHHEVHRGRDRFHRPVADTHALYFQFCNGGSLAMLRKKFINHRRRIPEVFIWHFLANMIESFAALHLGWTKGTPVPARQTRSAVYHSDLHPGNIFLHWPHDNRRLPEIFLGDFGNATVEPTYTANGRDCFRHDVKCLGDLLVGLVDKYAEEDGNWKPRFPATYSTALFVCCQKLTATHLPTAKEMLTDLLPVAQRHIDERLRPQGFIPAPASDLVRWTQPRVPFSPLFLPEVDSLTSQLAMAPLAEIRNYWYLRRVEVDRETFEEVRARDARMQQEATVRR